MTMWRALGVCAAALLCAVCMQSRDTAVAQGMMQQTQEAPPTVRVRAAISSIDGGILTIKSRDGAEMKLKLADNAPVNEVVKAPLSDIKEGSYLAITAAS